MASRVGKKYQIVIERDVRERLGVEPGSVAIETVVDGRLIIEFLPPAHRRSLAGSLSRYAKRPPPDVWAEAEQAWEAHAEERSRIRRSKG